MQLGKDMMMNKRKTIARISRPAGWITLLVMLVSSTALGQYDISWHTINSGGGTSSGGAYTLKGTIGQPEAGVMSGGKYELLGGFWPGGPLCTVNFYHFAIFAEHWLQVDCNAGNDWCGGADLDYLGDVDFNDVDLFLDQWLYYCPYNWPLK